jgi:hypothetical protein
MITLLVSAALVLARADAAPRFRPGAAWNDTDGRPINAHGGGILHHEGRYYWYGEHKEGPTTLPVSNRSWGGTRTELVGVHCYSSADLHAWKDEGLVLRAVLDDPGHDLHPSKVLERPKVLFNRKTGQFVMWVHVDTADYARAAAGVAVADSPTGPFRYLRGARPLGQMSRDQTVFQDDDGAAWHLFASEDNATLWIARLTDDYLGHTGVHARAFVGRSTEAPAVVKRDGRYWIIGSGCTGWAPNAARSAVADSPLGPWAELGNPCEGPDADTTFGSQGTYLLPVAGDPRTVLFLADRWNPHDLGASRHVWLPIDWEDGRPRLRWRAEWSLPSR